jgi:tRNA(fMet)-specific endonuclease VapC
MSAYVLDTDITTLLLRGQPSVSRHAAQTEPEKLAVTIVTVEEILTGWYTQIRRARRDDQLLRAYAALQQAVEFLASIRILALDEEALQRLHAFRVRKPPLATNDLRIAAIVLRYGATLVTRNTRDFKRLPGMQLEDWS